MNLSPTVWSNNSRKWLVVVVILAAGLGYTYYLYSATATELTTTRQEFASSTTAFSQQVTELQALLTKTQNEKSELETAYNQEKGRNNEFASQIGQISQTVGVLEKLRQLDKELLRKYSKVYFLNENYAPRHLTSIEPAYSASGNKEIILQAPVWNKLKLLVDNAAKENITIKVISAYRDFGEQSSLKAQYKVTYGSGANAFSADQGYSEHQLGTTVDLGSPETSNGLDGFDKTKAYPWLLANAHKFGFTLSYPQGNSYYIFEPWHWRYVGVQLATDLYNAQAHFYDWDQRKIDEYLIKIFD